MAFPCSPLRASLLRVVSALYHHTLTPVGDPAFRHDCVILLCNRFSKLSLYSCCVLVLLAGASMLDKRALPMQGVLISWMSRLFIHLLFVGPSRRSMRDGSMIFWRYSPLTPRSLMVQRITGRRPFGRGPSEKRLGCRCILTWYKKRIRRELRSR